MNRRWAAPLLVLALGLGVPGLLSAQAPPPTRPEEAKAELGQNYPNPFKIDTKIPFNVGGAPQCEDHSRLYRVSMRVYNILSQLVAVPVLRGGSGGVGSGEPLENVMLTCDRYEAYWNGLDRNTSREVSSGIYLVRLEVDGRPYTMRMTLRR